VLHFYVNDIRDRNIDLLIDSKCKNFAFKSRCTPLDSTKNFQLSGKHIAVSFISFSFFIIVDLLAAKIAGYTFM